MPKPTRYFYKVLTPNLQSCRACDWPHKLRNKYCIQYKVGEPTFPFQQGTKIFVFDSFENAQKFAYTTEIIFKVTAKNPRPAKTIAERWPDLDRFWTAKQLREHTTKFGIAPNGTIFCDSITLIEKVR